MPNISSIRGRDGLYYRIPDFDEFDGYDNFNAPVYGKDLADELQLSDLDPSIPRLKSNTIVSRGGRDEDRYRLPLSADMGSRFSPAESDIRLAAADEHFYGGSPQTYTKRQSLLPRATPGQSDPGDMYDSLPGIIAKQGPPSFTDRDTGAMGWAIPYNKPQMAPLTEEVTIFGPGAGKEKVFTKWSPPPPGYYYWQELTDELPQLRKFETPDQSRLPDSLRMLHTGRPNERMELDRIDYAARLRAKNNLELALLGPIFNAPGFYTRLFGGNEEQVESANQFGAIGLDIAGARAGTSQRNATTSQRPRGDSFVPPSRRATFFDEYPGFYGRTNAIRDGMQPESRIMSEAAIKEKRPFPIGSLPSDWTSRLDEFRMFPNQTNAESLAQLAAKKARDIAEEGMVSANIDRVGRVRLGYSKRPRKALEIPSIENAFVQNMINKNNLNPETAGYPGTCAEPQIFSQMLNNNNQPSGFMGAAQIHDPTGKIRAACRNCGSVNRYFGVGYRDEDLGVVPPQK
ncbi:hypothetical protein [Undibacterium umbellatum]|uniref:Uncharacterized protein n=1 Tax=Undibacterium umbellatum TaxID=2762300 RepID=A0ABR6Z8V3_9BURK|nr:hypothetical protein [Undibacterium umbellatum]MBC3908039.1 hypothetical protein [Undibacterium umbellatum]